MSLYSNTPHSTHNPTTHLSCSNVSAAPKIIRKGSKDWGAVNWDKLSEEWEDGDDENDLLSEDDLLMREMDERKAAAERKSGGPNDPKRKLREMDPSQASKGAANAAKSGPSMMFVDLIKEYAKDKTEFNKIEIETIATYWTSMLLTAGYEISAYPIEGNKILLSTKRGWLIDDVKAFILEQKEVESVTLDSVQTMSEHGGGPDL
jgi:hypothetical protein